jgi:hypothetical protein
VLYEIEQTEISMCLHKALSNGRFGRVVASNSGFPTRVEPKFLDPQGRIILLRANHHYQHTEFVTKSAHQDGPLTLERTTKGIRYLKNVEKHVDPRGQGRCNRLLQLWDRCKNREGLISRYMQIVLI